MRTIGQKRKFDVSDEKSLERLLLLKTRRSAYANKSANPAIGHLSRIGRQTAGYLPLTWETLRTAVFSLLNRVNLTADFR